MFCAVGLAFVVTEQQTEAMPFVIVFQLHAAVLQPTVTQKCAESKESLGEVVTHPEISVADSDFMKTAHFGLFRHGFCTICCWSLTTHEHL